MLSSKQRAQLRSLASQMEATTIIGANGITDAVINQVNMDFTNKELVKVKVLPNCGNVVIDCKKQVAKLTNSEEVCDIGNFFVLYKRNTRKNYRHLLEK